MIVVSWSTLKKTEMTLGTVEEVPRPNQPTPHNNLEAPTERLHCNGLKRRTGLRSSAQDQPAIGPPTCDTQTADLQTWLEVWTCAASPTHRAVKSPRMHQEKRDVVPATPRARQGTRKNHQSGSEVG